MKFAQREGVAQPHGKAMDHGRQGKADHGAGEAAAADDDDRMDVVEHPQAATHENDGDDGGDARDEAHSDRDIHRRLRRALSDARFEHA